jgi:hypothetical protein
VDAPEPSPPSPDRPGQHEALLRQLQAAVTALAADLGMDAEPVPFTPVLEDARGDA